MNQKNYSLWLGDTLIAMSSFKDAMLALKEDYESQCPGVHLLLVED